MVQRQHISQRRPCKTPTTSPRFNSSTNPHTGFPTQRPDVALSWVKDLRGPLLAGAPTIQSLHPGIPSSHNSFHQRDILASQEGMPTATSLQGNGAFTLVDIPDRVSNTRGADKAQEIVDMLDFVRQFGIRCHGQPDNISRPSTVAVWTSEIEGVISGACASYAVHSPFSRCRSCWIQRSLNAESSRLPQAVSQTSTRRP